MLPVVAIYQGPVIGDLAGGAVPAQLWAVCTQPHWTDSLREETSLFDHIDNIETDRPSCAIAKAEVEPLVVAFGVEVVLQHQIVFVDCFRALIGVEQITALKVGVEELPVGTVLGFEYRKLSGIIVDSLVEAEVAICVIRRGYSKSLRGLWSGTCYIRADKRRCLHTCHASNGIFAALEAVSTAAPTISPILLENRSQAILDVAYTSQPAYLSGSDNNDRGSQSNGLSSSTRSFADDTMRDMVSLASH